MSSMRRVAFVLPLLLGTATIGSTQTLTYPVRVYPMRPAYANPQPAAGYPISYALNDWRRLRQSGGWSFADYARFLVYNPNWPGETSMRLAAERAMRPGENPTTVIAFFTIKKPQT